MKWVSEEVNGWMDGRTDGRTNGWINEWTNEWMKEWRKEGNKQLLKSNPAVTDTYPNSTSSSKKRGHAERKQRTQRNTCGRRTFSYLLINKSQQPTDNVFVPGSDYYRRLRPGVWYITHVHVCCAQMSSVRLAYSSARRWCQYNSYTCLCFLPPQPDKHRAGKTVANQLIYTTMTTTTRAINRDDDVNQVTSFYSDDAVAISRNHLSNRHASWLEGLLLLLLRVLPLWRPRWITSVLSRHEILILHSIRSLRCQLSVCRSLLRT